MDQLVLAAENCDFANEPVCAPAEVSELFVFPSLFGTQINRTIVLTFLAAFVVMAVLYVAFRRRDPVPTKFGAAVEGVVDLVRNDIAVGVIGPDGAKYFPYLMSLFMFILVGNLFEVTPFVNFPITSRMAIPLFLALLTYVIFVFIGFRTSGLRYVTDLLWPPGVPLLLKPLVGVIEIVNVFAVRPFSHAVRLFANLVAGHTMLSLLLVTGWIFTFNLVTNFGEIGWKGLAGPAWFAFGLGIYVFEIIVSVVQAYIFTLLAAVYIQSSLHPGH